jgi:hypothetical protein
MKKYQEYIVGRCITEQPPEWEFKVFYVQVEERDGKRVVCGTPIDITHLDADPLLGIVAEELGTTSPDKLANVSPPEGWQVMSQYPLPDNYVPPSVEVFEEHGRRAMEHLKAMGLWRDRD